MSEGSFRYLIHGDGYGASSASYVGIVHRYFSSEAAALACVTTFRLDGVQLDAVMLKLKGPFDMNAKVIRAFGKGAPWRGAYYTPEMFIT